MKYWKKKIGIGVFAGMWMMGLLACAPEEETIDLADLQSMQSVEETFSQQGHASVSRVYVYICGEVVTPGVYEVASESRIYDVLLLAGGFTKDAAEEAVNLAEPVTDGMQVIIPTKEAEQQKKTEEVRSRSGMVNINTATAEELCILPGVGESRAQDIITYRMKYGTFQTIEEIMQVSGIKEGLFEKIKDKIYIE